jgi:allantoicase/CubicO group peptidase (beta-lactamase class C family)
VELLRWAVAAELAHGRVALDDVVRIAHEEAHFIRKDRTDGAKAVAVKFDEATSKWYPVALHVVLRAITDRRPVESLSALLLPFLLPAVRAAAAPLEAANAACPPPAAHRFDVQATYVARFSLFFEAIGSQAFAAAMAPKVLLDLAAGEAAVMALDDAEVVAGCSFHGDIGEAKKTLDAHGAQEQGAAIGAAEQAVKDALAAEGAAYREKFGVKFMVSAKGKTAAEMLEILRARAQNARAAEWATVRCVLWEIAQKRLALNAALWATAGLVAAHVKTCKIDSVMLSVSTPFGGRATIQNVQAGPGVTAETRTEVASLSKSVGSAFAIEYFAKHGISLDANVNELLATLGTDFRLRAAEDSAEADKADWPSQFAVVHLMQHFGLNLHYVKGVPADRKMPPVTEFLEGNALFGLDPIRIVNKPGSVFKYSGAGFILLQHILELHSGTPIAALTRPFLDGLGMANFSFDPESQPGLTYVVGRRDNGDAVEGTRHMYSPFAAGAMTPTYDMQLFLQHMTRAFNAVGGSGPISHETARRMCWGESRETLEFMACKMGTGIFVLCGTANKFVVHQGANDGYRVLFLHCVEGPDAGKGFTISVNAELNGVVFIAALAQSLLKELNIQGIDYAQFQENFASEHLQQEDVVNKGYRDMLFNAFVPSRAMKIIERGPRDAHAGINAVVGARLVACTNDKFARAENVMNGEEPLFDPELFDIQGKVMDSWESPRHNPTDRHTLHMALLKPAAARYVSLSTKWHTGNHAPDVRVLARATAAGQAWFELVAKTDIIGHAYKLIDLGALSAEFDEVKIEAFPDGGFTRLGLFVTHPDAASFKPLGAAQSVVWPDAIPETVKPLCIQYDPSPADIARNVAGVAAGAECNVASLALGASVLSASNEHYGPAKQVLSPCGALGMHDGTESARSRVPGSFEEFVVGLAWPAKLHLLVADFTHFVNNSPRFMLVEGLIDGAWVAVLPMAEVKHYAGSIKHIAVTEQRPIAQLRLKLYPCGGMNRVFALTYKE